MLGRGLAWPGNTVYAEKRSSFLGSVQSWTVEHG